MAGHVRIPPAAVHDVLRRHLLALGYPIVLDLEASHGPFAVDALSGAQYLDFSSFYGSNPLGYNHPSMLEADTQQRLARAAITKVGNPDFYTEYFAEFVDTLSRTAAPRELPHYFFVEGGALAVENGMKAAFDWKARKNLQAGRAAVGSQILHFEQAFHAQRHEYGPSQDSAFPEIRLAAHRRPQAHLPGRPSGRTGPRTRLTFGGGTRVRRAGPRNRRNFAGTGAV